MLPTQGEPWSRPQPTWRITTPLWETAQSVASRYLSPEPREVRAGQAFEVATGRTTLRGIIDGPDSVVFRMARRGGRGSAHLCDGARFLEPEHLVGTVCGCAPTLEARRAAARAGLGPKPDISVAFRLDDAPDIGGFGLSTSSWEFAEDIVGVLESPGQLRGPIECQLHIEAGGFITPTGVQVSYRRPRLLLTSRADSFSGHAQACRSARTLLGMRS